MRGGAYSANEVRGIALGASGVDLNNVIYKEETGMQKGGFLLDTFLSKRKVSSLIKG
jgi:hypothetical protein